VLKAFSAAVLRELRDQELLHQTLDTARTQAENKGMHRTKIIRASHFILLAFFLCSLVGLGQSSETQSSTDLNGTNANPTRTKDTHTENGTRILDTHSLQRLNDNGQYEPYQKIETETVKINSTTTRTITHTYGLADGDQKLVQVEEEEQQSRPGGSSLTRTVSNPDADGRLQTVQREIQRTKKISDTIEDTKTTVMLPGVNGLAPAMQSEERRIQSADGILDSRKTTSLPDGSGNWQLSETRHSVTKKLGGASTTEEHVCRPDADGKLTEISHTITSGTDDGKRDTTEKYSLDVPGTPQDGDLHLIERSTTTQRANSAGEKTTQHQVENPNPGDPSAGLQVTAVTTDTARPVSSGTKSTRTVQSLDPNGDLTVVSVDTTKTDGTAVQVQVAPNEKKK
jgi:hypothetical protein